MNPTSTADLGRPVIIVTGASRGIGLAVATILLKEFNACVVAMARKSNDALVALAAEHQDTVMVALGDIVDPKTSQEAVHTAIEQWGHLDGIVLNAGVIEPTGTVESVRVESTEGNQPSWKSIFDVNFFSLVYTVQAALPELRKSPKGGRVIMVSSGSATKGKYGMGPYGATKAAMNSLARTLAVEEPDVTVVALRPGVVDTDMQSQIRSSTTLRPIDIKPFVDMHASNALVSVNQAGYVLASLAISATRSLSGEFVSWDSEECAPFRRK